MLTRTRIAPPAKPESSRVWRVRRNVGIARKEVTTIERDHQVAVRALQEDLPDRRGPTIAAKFLQHILEGATAKIMDAITVMYTMPALLNSVPFFV